MKKIIVPVIFSLLYNNSFSQQWRNHKDPLRSPVNISNYKIAVGFFNRLDTVACKYKINGRNEIFNGFKLVYFFDGYYTDTQNTIDVFFDDKKKRAYNVTEYQMG